MTWSHNGNAEKRFLCVSQQNDVLTVWTFVVLFTIWLSVRPAVAQAPDLIVFNGKIAVVDDKMSFVQAMAIREDIIVGTGASADILKLAGPSTKRLDLNGRTVVPGIVDPHRHLDGFRAEDFPELRGTRVPPGQTREEVKRGVLDAVRKGVQQTKPGQWILVYPAGKQAQETILLEEINTVELDKVAPNHPVMVNETGQGANVQIVFNSRAKEIIGREFPAFKRFSDNYTKADGVSLSKLVLQDIILRGREKEYAESLRKLLIDSAPPLGITSIGDKITRTAVNSLFLIDRKGEMPIRFGWFIGYGSYYYPEGFFKAIPNLAGIGSKYVFSIGMGEEVTESPTTGLCTTVPLRNTELKAMYEQAKIDLCYLHNPIVRSTIKDQIAYGRGVEYHGAGDKTTDLLLEIIEEAQRETGLTDEQIRDKRITIEHLAMVRPDQLPKIKKYGLIMVHSPGYFLRNLNKSQTANIPQNFGEEYLKWHQPVKSGLDAGIQNIMGEIGSPFQAMQMYVTRRACFTARLPEQGEVGVEKCAVIAPEQAVDRNTALKMATSWAAYYLLKEKELGSLEPGKMADFIVLDRDYFTIPEQEIAKTKVLLTALGGKVVFASPDFGPVDKNLFKSPEYIGRTPPRPAAE